MALNRLRSARPSIEPEVQPRPRPTPTPTPRPMGRPTIETDVQDPNQPFQINLDEFLKNPDAVQDLIKNRKMPPPRQPWDQGSLNPEGMDPAAGNPEDYDLMKQLMQEIAPEMEAEEPPAPMPTKRKSMMDRIWRD